MNTAAIIVFVGLLVFVAHLFEKIFEETKIPDVLLLIILGVLIGPVFNFINISDFGLAGPIFITLALVVILFQGGTKLKLESLGRSAGGAAGLTFVSFILTSLSTAGITYLLTDLGIVRAAMLGAIIGGTSSAIVIPLVRQLEMREESSIIMQLESALSDVLAIVVGLAFLDAYILGEFNFLFVIERIFTSFLVAGLMGFAAGIVWSILLDKVRHIKDSIFTTPAFVFVIFGLVEFLGYSGAIAALAFGITLGNVQALKLPLISRYTPLKALSLSKRESAFFSEIVFLVKTFFFLYMGISMQFENTTSVLIGLLLALVIVFVRVVAVRVSVTKSTPAFDASLMSVIVPKGLAAAVLASIPLQLGVPYGDIIQNITYAVILFTIVLTSIMVFLVEKTKVYKFYQKIFANYGQQAVESTVVNQI